MATRKIKIGEKEYYFNFKNFIMIFDNYCRKNKLKKGNLEEDLSLFVNKDASTIHNWRNSTSGPSDLDTIKLIADYFKVEYESLLERRCGAMKKLEDVQLMSIKRIYDEIINYLEEFNDSNGFNDYWFDLDIEKSNREGALCDIALAKVNKVIVSYKKEYMFLNNTKIYEELGNYIFNDLYDIFDNKLSYAYRFEAETNGNPTTDEDYYKAISEINKIIDKYVVWN